jgi:malate dehydrogenase (oxaloacetate-decarboxylating)(NADP+)
MNKREQALAYHQLPKPGKLSVESSKPCATQLDLSLAYTPGVAEPVREIAKDAENAYRYTNKGNLVAVITDGTAILGLGNLGPLASKPVMEGKAVLFKRFAGIDVFDIEVNAPSVQAFIETVVNIAPTFGGINLEDIAAPHCFEIEQALRERLDIPVFHDDQHGTAIVMCAGLLNALEVQSKKVDQIKLVCLGAGAAGLACMRLLITMGGKKENMILVDSKGVIHKGRTDLNAHKQEFAQDTTLRTLEEAMQGADVFIGVSGSNLVNQSMVKSMAARPVIFAMANPDPEIFPAEAHAVRDDLVMATGRSDFPNQVNNVLGFPYIFRGTLDARAKEPVPQEVLDAYGLKSLAFGRDYILPKPFDPRLIDRIPPAVAAAVQK